jgi:hypothetical protein
MSDITKEKIEENLNKPPLILRHSDLERCSDNSPFRSHCSACDQGILLVQRRGAELLRADYCVLCGRRYFYIDDEISGIPLYPKLIPWDQKALFKTMVS